MPQTPRTSSEPLPESLESEPGKNAQAQTSVTSEIFLRGIYFSIDSQKVGPHNYAIERIEADLGKQKKFRQGQILKLILSEAIGSQDDLRKRLAQMKLRVTQATLSRDIAELKLVKTGAGYKPLKPGGEVAQALPPLARAVREYLLDIRPADNLLVLKTPPGGAQALAAAVDSERFHEVAGTIAGDDTVLLITPSRAARTAVQTRLETLLK
jgi:transcriptional regulator of arginine metabolism